MAALWFMFLALPLLAVRVDTLHGVVEWHWGNLLWVGAGTFTLALLWHGLSVWRQRRGVATTS